MTIAHNFTLFGGSSNPELAEAVARELGVAPGASEAVETAGWAELRVVSIAPLIAGAIGRFMQNGSFQDLYR